MVAGFFTSSLTIATVGSVGFLSGVKEVLVPIRWYASGKLASELFQQ